MKASRGRTNPITVGQVVRLVGALAEVWAFTVVATAAILWRCVEDFIDERRS